MIDKDTTGDFLDHLIAMSGDPASRLAVDERVLYALMTMPKAAKEACPTPADWEPLVLAVTAAVHAAVTAALAEPANEALQ